MRGAHTNPDWRVARVMFLQVSSIPQHLRSEPAAVAAIGPVLASLFAEIVKEPPPQDMQRLLRRVSDRAEPERYWKRFYASDDAAA